MNEYLINILKEMCLRVGAYYDKIDFKSNDWYLQYFWNEEEEKDFVNWLSDYLYNNTKARNSLVTFPRKNKKETRKVAEEFVWNYGWRQPRIKIKPV